MTLLLLFTLSVTLGSIFLEATDAQDVNAIDLLIDYVDKSIKIAPTELLTEPTNNFGSINYLLYTRSNPKEACFIEPTLEEFDSCPFNSNRKTIFFIHGSVEILQPGSLFEELKDTILEYDEYNIIMVNWTLYNGFPLTKALQNVPKVGKRVAETMQFIIDNKGAVPEQFHCIGHSSGCHVCGNAARRIRKFKRVTGLDPGGIPPLLKLLGIDIALKYTDADYVDVIHTSAVLTTGLGTFQPLGDMDFYVDGGVNQKHCKFGRKYRAFKGVTVQAQTPFDLTLCNHFIPIEYFINSVKDDCVFLGTECENFVSAVLNPVIKSCSSNSSLTAKMGFHSKKIQGLPPKSAFSVETSGFPPYCKDQKQIL